MADMENPTCHVAFFRTSMDAEVLSACADIMASRGYSGPATPATELFELIHLLRPDFDPDFSLISPSEHGVRCDVLLARYKGSRPQVYFNIACFETLVNPSGSSLFCMDPAINTSLTMHASTAYVTDLDDRDRYTTGSWTHRRTRTSAACSSTAVFSCEDDLSVGLSMDLFGDDLYPRSPEWAKFERRLESWNLAGFSHRELRSFDPRCGVDLVADVARGGFPSFWSHAAVGPTDPVVYTF